MYKLSYLKYQFFYNSSNLKKKYFKINRQLIIFNFLNKLKFYVYNGKKWMFIYVNIQKHIWKKFGEFYFTKKDHYI